MAVDGRNSATVEIFDPQTALFYLAFLPQLTDATAGFQISVQFLVLGRDHAAFVLTSFLA